MKSRLEQLAERRARLVARSDYLRAELAYQFGRLEGPVHLAENAFGFANSLRRSPLFLAAVAAVLIRTPWRKFARLTKLAWRGWKIMRFARGLVKQRNRFSAN